MCTRMWRVACKRVNAREVEKVHALERRQQCVHHNRLKDKVVQPAREDELRGVETLLKRLHVS